ncbi:MAG: ABC transporter permease subunit [Dehalococcoidales bacterium]|nr:ABC transporter permease subunit [Dehalococcoidales bacterium]
MKRLLDAWPKSICFLLAIIPLCVLVLIIVSLSINLQPVFQQPTSDLNRDGIVDQQDYIGLKGIFSTQISGIYSSNKGQFGLIPAIWGTVIVVTIAIVIAAPISLAMAILSSEFTLGFLGKGIRALLGILAGIPPVIYALMAVFIFQLLIEPNIVPSGTPPPWYSNLSTSKPTLLAGIMLSLLLIPFLSPLFEDAIRNVPNYIKEASIGLGATRWHTLWNVTIPGAFSGIISASGLGILKVMGEVIIVTSILGYEGNIPSPFFDILRRLPPLTATGAGFAGGIDVAYRNPLGDAMANVAGLILIIMAIIVIVAVHFLQKQFKRRFSYDAR